MSLADKVALSMQAEFANAVFGKNPRFYTKVTGIKRYEDNRFLLLKDTFYDFLDKIL